MSASLPLPALDAENRAFWTGGEHGQLLVTRCTDCRRWLHPPVPVCRFCLSIAVEAEPVSGLGEILTYTVNRQQWVPDLEVPYVLAYVQLDDDPGLRVSTRLVGVKPEDVRIGLRVTVVFEQVDDVWLPLFTPVSESGA